MHVKKSTRKPPIGECCLPDCRAEVRSAGRCGIHYQELRRDRPEEIERLKGLTPEERSHHYYRLKYPLPPKWSYEGNEDWLIKRQEYLATHSVPMFTNWSELDEMILQEESEKSNG